MNIPYAVRLRSTVKSETIRKEDLETAAQMIEEAKKPYIFRRWWFCYFRCIQRNQ